MRDKQNGVVVVRKLAPLSSGFPLLWLLVPWTAGSTCTSHQGNPLDKVSIILIHYALLPFLHLVSNNTAPQGGPMDKIFGAAGFCTYKYKGKGE